MILKQNLRMQALKIIIIFLMGISSTVKGEHICMDTLPYFQIPDAPEFYNEATVSARMVDGLGYRYYWATEGLRPSDLAYDPGNDGKLAGEVLEHILGLSRFILRTTIGEAHIGQEYPDLSWKEQRKETLLNLKKASDVLRSRTTVEDLTILFKREDRTNEFPFWNMINGPIADAIYHVGQIVSYRRSSGNPMNPNVSVFSGKTRQ